MQREFKFFSYFVKPFTKLGYSSEICKTEYKKGNYKSNNDALNSKKTVQYY